MDEWMNVTAGICVVRADLESLTSALRVLLVLIFTFVCITSTTKHQGCVYVADYISETPDIQLGSGTLMSLSVVIQT